MYRRIANLIKGFLSLFISGLEMQNPEAVLEAEKENLREQIGKYNQGLASHAGLCERLMSQVRKLENEQKRLKGEIDGLMTEWQEVDEALTRLAEEPSPA